MIFCTSGARAHRVSYRITTDDLIAVALARSVHSPVPRILRTVFLAMFGVLVPAGILAAVPLTDALGTVLTVAAAAAAGYSLIRWFPHVLLQWEVRRDLAEIPAAARAATVEISPRGICETTGQGPAIVRWAAVEEVIELPEAILIYAGDRPPIIIPRRAFASREAADAFAHAAKMWHAAATGR